VAVVQQPGTSVGSSHWCGQTLPCQAFSAMSQRWEAQVSAPPNMSTSDLKDPDQPLDRACDGHGHAPAICLLADPTVL
jgi:hypothetical protein